VVPSREADVRVQGRYGVNYKQYWVDEGLLPRRRAGQGDDNRVHREAHGLEAHTLYEVEAGVEQKPITDGRG
jgi:hypothetical protein